MPTAKKETGQAFIEAGAPEQANELYEYMLKEAAKVVPVVQHGIFGADMKFHWKTMDRLQ